jgi:ferric-dicitrate binding protein FerR (iron transport regulator)
MSDDQEQLVLKLLHGTITAGERAVLEQWTRETQENQKAVDDYILMWKLSREKDVEVNYQTGDEWKKLEASISTETRKNIRLQPQVPWLKVAATIAFLVLFTWVLYLIVFNHETIVKESGESLVELTLPDGSRVWLNRHSRLRFDESFGSAKRAVNLEGEAFFEIKRDSLRPFIVETAIAQVKVLGTSFNVRANAGAGKTEVFVASGLVKFAGLKNINSGVNLKAGQAAMVSSNNTVVVKKEVSLNALAWKEKRLVFKGTSLHAAIESVEEYFAVNIEFRNQSISACRFTGTFHDPTLDEIIEAISVSLDLKIEKTGSTYVIDGRGC